jgi:hypothetical protein
MTLEKSRAFLFVFLFFYSFGWCADPIKDIAELKVSHDKVELVRPLNAQVILADYDLIKRDFSKETNGMSNSEIDKWILNYAGYISKSQLKGDSVVNTPIPYRIHENSNRPAEEPEGYRPETYGRGLMFKTKNGLLEGKGFGANNPEQKSHKNGLATTGEMIREFGFEKLVHSTFKHYRDHFNKESELDTVRSYAVIDFGFDVIHSNGQQSPAGAILRQAHNRVAINDGNTFLPGQEAVKIEKVLRMYGITSAADPAFYKKHWGHYDFDIADLQGTSKNEVVDFGTFRVRDDFKKDVEFMGKVKNEVGLDKDRWDFVHPKSDISIPQKVWGYEGDGSSGDNLKRFADQLARDFRNHNVERQSIEKKLLSTFLSPVLKKWSNSKISKDTYEAMKTVLDTVVTINISDIEAKKASPSQCDAPQKVQNGINEMINIFSIDSGTFLPKAADVPSSVPRFSEK